MALLYARQGRTQEARAQFNVFRGVAEHWVETYPDYGHSYIAQGLVLAHLGQPERGWEAAQKALEVDTDPTLYLGLARLACVRGQNATALDLLAEGIDVFDPAIFEEAASDALRESVAVRSFLGDPAVLGRVELAEVEEVATLSWILQRWGVAFGIDDFGSLLDDPRQSTRAIARLTKSITIVILTA